MKRNPVFLRLSAAGLAVFMLICAVSGCSGASAGQSGSASFFAMDTIMEMTAYGEGGQDALDQVEHLIFTLEDLFSATDQNSEVYAANQGLKVALSDYTADILDQSLALCALTNGALDITVRPIMDAWGFTTSDYRVPDSTEIDALLPFVDYSLVTPSPDGTLTLPAGVQIDMGAVAKGYASDLAAQLLAENGINSAILSLGGNVMAVGAKPDGSNWRVGIKDPSGNTDYIGVVEVNNKAVVTSGGYERYFTGDDGQVYWHIIDPSTGYPAKTGLSSVTIIGDSGILCDALSTALFVMGADDALDFWRDNGGFEAIFIAEDGEIIITSGLKDVFTPSDTSATVTVASYDR